MKFLEWLLGSNTTYSTQDSSPKINPASGLPMIDESGIDVGGNSFGSDSSHDYHSTSDWGSSSNFGSFD